MPPRHVYWTIIYGNQATSFRAATPEELLPTLKQLQSRHPDAVLKYFARGRLWNSAEEARAPYDDRRRDDRWNRGPRPDQPRQDRPRQDRPHDERWNKGPRQGRPREDTRPGDRPRKEPWRRDAPPADQRDRRDQKPAGGQRPNKPEGERRGKEWRPGGEHRDPRDRWKVPRAVKRKRFAQRLRRDPQRERSDPTRRPPRRRPPKKKDEE